MPSYPPPASPPTPPRPTGLEPPDPEISPWDEEEGAMEAEDRYLNYLEGPHHG